MNAGPPTPEPLRSALDRLTAEGATGALRVGGTPGGTIWLVDGEIRYADTPVLPDAGERLTTARLTAAGRASDRAWYHAYQSARLDGGGARTLVDGGHLQPEELATQVLAGLYEAARLLLGDADAPARFHVGLRHWLGDVTGVGLADLDAEIGRHRVLGDAPAPAAEPALPQAADGAPAMAGGPVVPVVPGTDDHADGGLVDAAIDEAEEITAAASPPDAGHADAGRPNRAGANLPRRNPGRTGAGGPPKSGANAGPHTDAADAARSASGPDYATLRRIRQALKSIT